MKFSALVFLASGLAYLVWGLSLTVMYGVGLGSVPMALFAAALLYQAYDLFQNKPGAGWRGIISSSVIIIAAVYIGSVFILPRFPQSLLELPTEVWPVFGSAVIVSVAHTAVVVLLVLGKYRPNNAFNRTR